MAKMKVDCLDLMKELGAALGIDPAQPVYDIYRYVRVSLLAALSTNDGWEAAAKAIRRERDYQNEQNYQKSRSTTDI